MGLNIDGNNSFLPNFFKTGSSEQNQEMDKKTTKDSIIEAYSEDDLFTCEG